MYHGISKVKHSGLIIVAAAMALLLAAPLQAALVTLEMEVNGGTAPVTVQVGDNVMVQLFGTVTDNTYNSIDLGLTLYAANIISSGGVLAPVQGFDPFAGAPDGQWAVTWAVPDFAAKARGNVTGGDVLGHGSGLTSFNFDVAQIAITRTLLATGYFQAVEEGYGSIGFGDVMAQVMWYDNGFTAVLADTVIPSGGADVNVVPEPATMGLLAVGLAALARRQIRRRRAAA